MAINVSQPFHRTSANAVDDTLTLTKAEMKTVNDNLMPSKYLTVCQDDGLIYLYDKSNTVDSTTGKFRVFESGGGGHEIEDDSGTALTQRETMQFGDGFNVSDDSTNEKTIVEPNLMTSADMDDVVTPLPGTFARYHEYSTTEQVVGKWIDGATLYEKTLQITMPSANESSISTGVENGNHARIVDGFIEQTGSSDGNYSFPVMFDSGSPLTTKVLIQVTVSGSHLYVYSNFDKTDGKTAYITIQYTKTT